MKRRLSASLVLASFLISTFVYAGSPPAKVDELASLLPESDGVLTLDVQQLFGKALPQILAENEPLLVKINGEVDKIKQRTGLDIRRFDRLAAGWESKKAGANDLTFEPVVLARGGMDSKSLIAVAKLASNGKVRTERYAGRDIYIFSSEALVQRNKPQGASGNSLIDKLVGKIIDSLSGEMAITAFDEKTVAFGSLARVKKALGDSPRISGRVLSMIDADRPAVGRMGMLLPDGMSAFLELEDDELGSALDSIRELRGSLGVLPDITLVSIAVAAVDDKKAEELEFMVLGLQAVFSKILQRQKGADKRIYGKMLEDMAVRRNGNEVLLDLKVLQTDLNVIVGKK